MNKERLHNIFERCEAIAKEKNKQYGDKNIMRHGAFGVMVRLGDKMDRIENQLSLGDVGRDNEKIADNIKDSINYLAYLLMLMEGSFADN